MQLFKDNPLFGLYLYPFAKEIMEKQQDIFWTAQEIAVEKDIQDFKIKMNKHQYDLFTLTLQLFVETEQRVGDIWSKVAKLFPHSEIEGTSSFISSMEKSVHAFFYQKVNDVLNLEPEEIYKNQQTIKPLKDKLDFLNKVVSNIDNNIPLGLVTVALIEQVFLFSNFAMLKSFKANGYNLAKNTLTGVDFVIQDETLHGLFASGLYNIYIKEYKEENKDTFNKYYNNLLDQIRVIVEHVIDIEDNIINYIFKDTDMINDIKPEDLHKFIRGRANKVLEDINIKPLYKDTINAVDEWFYQGANSLTLHDFFSTNSNQYRRNWKVEGFSLLPFIKEENE